MRLEGNISLLRLLHWSRRGGSGVGGEGVYNWTEFFLHKVHEVHANIIGNGRWRPWRSLDDPLSGLHDLLHPRPFLSRAEGGGGEGISGYRVTFEQVIIRFYTTGTSIADLSDKFIPSRNVVLQRLSTPR